MMTAMPSDATLIYPSVPGAVVATPAHDAASAAADHCQGGWEGDR